jgi:hypothetical protein
MLPSTYFSIISVIYSSQGEPPQSKPHHQAGHPVLLVKYRISHLIISTHLLIFIATTLYAGGLQVFIALLFDLQIVGVAGGLQVFIALFLFDI